MPMHRNFTSKHVGIIACLLAFVLSLSVCGFVLFAVLTREWERKLKGFIIRDTGFCSVETTNEPGVQLLRSESIYGSDNYNALVDYVICINKDIVLIQYHSSLLFFWQQRKWHRT